MTTEELISCHIERAEQNWQFADQILATFQPTQAELSWATVAVFYSAVHYVNAYLIAEGQAAPKSHAKREKAMSKCTALIPLQGRYGQLLDASKKARYNPGYQATWDMLDVLRNESLTEITVSILRSLQAAGHVSG